MENQLEQKNPKKRTAILAILIVTLMISTTGATYAFFALSATNTGTITGETATVGEDTLSVTEVLPTSSSTNTGVMVPQYSAYNNRNALKSAIDGGCVDGNTNIACKVYKVSYQNSSSSTIRVNSTLTLTSEITNLKWYTIATANNVATNPTSATYTYPATFTAAYGNAKTVTALGDAQTLDSTKWRYWNIVIWVEEKGTDQYSADGNKNFTGTVNVQLTDASGNVLQGLTSTFTG